MDYYCVGCNRSVDGHRYDVVIGRCSRCAKKYKKRTRTIEHIMEHYSDVHAGELMMWHHRMVLVMERTSNGWVVRHLETGNDIQIIVNGYDSFESFTQLFRRIGDDEKS